MESFTVAAMTMLCVPLPGMLTLVMTKGCAYIWSSTARVNTRPNWLVLTLLVLRTVSFRFAPVRALSLCCVSTATAASDSQAKAMDNNMQPRRHPAGATNLLGTSGALTGDLFAQLRRGEADRITELKLSNP